MSKIITKHTKQIDLTYIIPKTKIPRNTIETSWDTPLNKALTDKIGFTVQKDNKGNIVKIDRITYETLINRKWEWIFRFDDHGGVGPIHGHFRISIKNDAAIEVNDSIKKFKNKNTCIPWVYKFFRKQYIDIRRKFIKENKLKEFVDWY